MPDAGDLMEQISTYVMAVAPGTDQEPEDPLAGGDNLFAAARCPRRRPSRPMR
jgi:hypothetical protein